MAEDRSEETPAGVSRVVFMIAGEASGDWSGALLARALRKAEPSVAVEGIGGRRMAGAGVNILHDSSSWGAIGLCEGLTKVPLVWRALRETTRRLATSPPSALVLIDFGAYNLRVARAARPLGIPVLYYFPPGSWSRQRPALELRGLADIIATPFPWSAELLAGGRARVEWVGHPVVETARPSVARERAYSLYRVDPNRPTVALAPGSRDQELCHLLPMLTEAAARIVESFPGTQFLVPVAPSVDRDHVAAALRRAGVNATLLRGMEYDALQLAQAAAVCSGTATLEFCVLGIPMVVIYRTSRVTTFQYRVLRGFVGGQRYAAMPNIIAGREIVPERMGSAATPASVAETVGALLSDGNKRVEMKRELELVAATLGTPGASARTAELVLGLMTSREASRVSPR